MASTAPHLNERWLFYVIAFTHRARFNYVSKLEHAHLLLDGKVFHQTLGYFRDYEDSVAKQVIGEEFESTRIFRPADGLQVNNHQAVIYQWESWNRSPSPCSGAITDLQHTKSGAAVEVR